MDIAASKSVELLELGWMEFSFKGEQEMNRRIIEQEKVILYQREQLQRMEKELTMLRKEMEEKDEKYN